MMKVAHKKMELSKNILGGLGDAALILRMKSKEMNDPSPKVFTPPEFTEP